MQWIKTEQTPPPRDGRAILVYYPNTYEPCALVVWSPHFEHWAHPDTGYARLDSHSFSYWLEPDHPTS